MIVTAAVIVSGWALVGTAPATALAVLDAGFGSNGVMTDGRIPTGGGSPPVRTAVQADGRLLVAGTTTNYAPFVARYLSDGRPDPSFGDAGVVRLDPSVMVVADVAVAP